MRRMALLLRMVWETSRLLFSLIIVLRLARSFAPIAMLWISRLILDATVGRLVHNMGSTEHIWKLVFWEFLVTAAAGLLARANTAIGTILSDRFANRVSMRLMEHSITLDLCSLEDAAVQDKLDRARRQSSGRMRLVVVFLDIWQDSLSLACFSAGLIAFSPWLIALLTVAVIPPFLGESHYARLAYSLLFRRTPDRRLLDYLRYLGASAQSAREVQIFGLGEHLCDRFKTQADVLETETENLARRGALAGGALNLVSTAGYYGCYAIILATVLAGKLTLGALMFVTGAFSRSSSCIERIFSSVNELAAEALFLDDFFDFLSIQPSIKSPINPLPVARPVRTGFEFRNVGFTYPGSSQWALRHINLRIDPGETIAIVGENGAGKTTLVKLLMRLYAPTEGQILLDGSDLREYDLGDFRQQIGIIFQDYMRYDLAVRDNIGFGNIRLRADSARLEAAATRSFAHSFIGRLPDGYDQILGKRFAGGADLSGGEWQKLALARAWMRDAQLLILDEPTASLDARSEYQTFQRLAASSKGRMALLISHRFSTVRMADRILVLENGHVREQGTHQQLLSRAGRYAELFELQARAYR